MLIKGLYFLIYFLYIYIIGTFKKKEWFGTKKKMNDLVFVMYNLKLKERHRQREFGKPSLIEDAFENIPSDDEWVTEREGPVLPSTNKWLRVLDENPNNVTSDEESEDDEVQFIAKNIQSSCK